MLIRNRIPTAETVADAQKIVGAALAVEKDPLRIETPGGRLSIYRPRTCEGWRPPAKEVAITSTELRKLQPWWPAETAFKVARLKSLLRTPIWLSEAAPANPLHAGSYVILTTRRDTILLWMVYDERFSAEWRPTRLYERYNLKFAGFVDEVLSEHVVRTIPRRLGNGRISAWEKKPISSLECGMQWRPVQPPKLAPMSPVSRETERYLASRGLKVVPIKK